MCCSGISNINIIISVVFLKVVSNSWHSKTSEMVALLENTVCIKNYTKTFLFTLNEVRF